MLWGVGGEEKQLMLFECLVGCTFKSYFIIQIVSKTRPPLSIIGGKSPKTSALAGGPAASFRLGDAVSKMMLGMKTITYNIMLVLRRIRMEGEGLLWNFSRKMGGVLVENRSQDDVLVVFSFIVQNLCLWHGQLYQNLSPQTRRNHHFIQEHAQKLPMRFNGKSGQGKPALICVQCLMIAINQIIILMNWTETNPFLTFFYPFYNLPLALRPQDHCFSLPYPFLSQNDSEAKECIKNLKSFDTQPNLSSEKLDLRAAPELRKKAIRKQKILKRREREDNFERKKQKKDRNLPSNIFKYFISHLYSLSTLNHLAAALSSPALSFSPLSFISKIKATIKQSQSYIRPAVIQGLYYGCGLSEGESLAFRIMLKRFLLLDLPILIAPMQKYKKRQRRELINLGRKLFEQMKMKAFQ